MMSSNIRTSRVFQNPKYAECIEACNHCANACEYCGSLCLREENIRIMLKCIELCFYVQTFVDLLQSICHVIVVMQNKSVKPVQKYVRHVSKNVKDIIWTIVNNVHNYAMNVRRFVEICNIIK
jgi:hypothetical protein